MLKDASKALGLLMQPQVGYIPIGLNTEQWARTEVVKIPKEVPIEEKFKQVATEGTFDYALMTSNGAGISNITTKVEVPLASRVYAKEILPGVYELKNAKIKAVIEGGRVISLVDLELDREVIPQGRKGNQLVIFDDKYDF